MVKVKICGITNLEDAAYAAYAGADALGFVFYKKSPRYIKPQKAKSIISHLPKSIKKVGVFVNARERTIRMITRYLGLDMLQFHGNESKDFCGRFRDYKVIKAFRVKDRIDFVDLFKYDVWAYLFDTFAKNKFGGTGRRFNWGVLNCLKNSKKIIFLSGGLNYHNVRKALKNQPVKWVDASSSLEKYPGKKEPEKIKKFIKAIKG